MCKVLTRWNTAPGFDRTPAPSHPTGISPVFACPSVSPKCTPVACHQKKPKKKRGAKRRKAHTTRSPKKNKKTKSMRWQPTPCVGRADHWGPVCLIFQQITMLQPERHYRSIPFEAGANVSLEQQFYLQLFHLLPDPLTLLMAFCHITCNSLHHGILPPRCSDSKANVVPTPKKTQSLVLTAPLHPVTRLVYPRFCMPFGIPEVYPGWRPPKKKKKCVASSSNVAFNLCFTQ